MKRADQRSHLGFSIVEMMVGIVVLAVIMGIGGTAMTRLWTVSGQMRREAEELRVVLAVGEQWRNDMRRTEGSPVMELEGSSQVVRLPQHNGLEIQWAFDGGNLLRRTAPDHPWTCRLVRVRHSAVREDRREQVVAWRWDLELEPITRRSRHVRHFTFLAVPVKTEP